jgi:hypothetical protein
MAERIWFCRRGRSGVIPAIGSLTEHEGQLVKIMSANHMMLHGGGRRCPKDDCGWVLGLTALPATAGAIVR